MKKKFFLVAATIFSSQLFAQQDSTVHALDEVIVTASKYPQKRLETGKVVTVINARELSRSSGRTLMEVLNTVAGVTISGANNNAGTNQTVSLRGSSAGNTLILLDGIPVNDPSVITNYFDLNLLSIDQVERIEILKGGQSTLYGSDAVAGVINIISKRPTAKKLAFNAGLSAGSYNTFKQSLALNGMRRLLDYSIGYTHLRSRGFSSAMDTIGDQDFDKDGFEQHATNARLGIRLSSKLKLLLSGQYNFYRTDLDNTAFTDEKDFTVRNRNAQAGAGITYTHRLGALHANYSYNYTRRAYLDDSIYKGSPYVDYTRSRYSGSTHYAEIYNNMKLSHWDLLTGIDYRGNHTDQFYFSTGPFGPYEPPVLTASMNQWSPYASLQYRGDNGFNLEFGGRWNYHSEYGSNFTYTFNPSYVIGKRYQLFANLYSAFKAPTLYQLFDQAAGNADLRPEKAVIAEAGAAGDVARGLHTRVLGFYRNTRNAIQFIIVDPNTFESQYRNVSSQRDYGLELELSYTMGKFTARGNYTYTDGKTRSGYDGTGAPLGKDTTYYNLYRIPKQAWNISLGWQATEELFLSTQMHAVSKREEFIYGAVPETLRGYALIDVYVEYLFRKELKCFFDCKNVGNKKYVDLLGYNSKRFNVNAGIQFKL